MLKVARFLFALVVVCVLMSFTAQMDMDDEAQEHAVYCANVYDNTWPDYEGRYLTDCENGAPKKVSK